MLGQGSCGFAGADEGSGVFRRTLSANDSASWAVVVGCCGGFAASELPLKGLPGAMTEDVEKGFGPELEVEKGFAGLFEAPGPATPKSVSPRLV